MLFEKAYSCELAICQRSNGYAPLFPTDEERRRRSTVKSIVHESKGSSRDQSRELTRLKRPFGRLLHLFLVPECDFSLGYHSAEEVANDRDPERRPTTAFSRVAEVEKSIECRAGAAAAWCRDSRAVLKFRFVEESGYVTRNPLLSGLKPSDFQGTDLICRRFAYPPQDCFGGARRAEFSSSWVEMTVRLSSFEYLACTRFDSLDQDPGDHGVLALLAELLIAILVHCDRAWSPVSLGVIDPSGWETECDEILTIGRNSSPLSRNVRMEFCRQGL